MENRVRQNRGRGDGHEYKPWLFVHDVASRGRSSRIASGGRVVHTLSDWETAAYRDFQWDMSVIDIREQYPLPLEDTLRIAEQLRIQHPVDRSTGTPVVMTTDFLVTIRSDDGPVLLARAVKETSAVDLALARNSRDEDMIRRCIEKLEVERRYWADRGVHWMLLTEQRLSKVRKSNIEFILSVDPDPDRPEGYWANAVKAVSDAIVAGGTRSLDELGKALVSAGCLIHRQDFVVCVRWLCAKRKMTFDIDVAFTLLRPAADFRSLDHAVADAS